MVDANLIFSVKIDNEMMVKNDYENALFSVNNIDQLQRVAVLKKGDCVHITWCKTHDS